MTLTFERMRACYCTYLRHRYEWGTVYDEIRDESPAYQLGYLRGVEENCGRWIEDTFRARCETARLCVEPECSTTDEVLWRLTSNSHVLLSPFQLPRWSRLRRPPETTQYTLRLRHVDDLETLHLVAGQTRHAYGVTSEKYRARGWVDTEHVDAMFRAMMVDTWMDDVLDVTKEGGTLYHVLQYDYT